MTIVEEKLMDAVVCASGSSPAYVYMFIEALADSAVKYGIPRADAYKLGGPDRAWKRKDGAGDRRASGTLKRQGLLPGRNHHCRSGALEEYGMRNAVIKATDACYAKCKGIQ